MGAARAMPVAWVEMRVTTMTRILIADDHEMVRTGERGCLSGRSSNVHLTQPLGPLSRCFYPRGLSSLTNIDGD